MGDVQSGRPGFVGVMALLVTLLSLAGQGQVVAGTQRAAVTGRSSAVAAAGLSDFERQRLVSLISEVTTTDALPSMEIRRECWALLDKATPTEVAETRRAVEVGGCDLKLAFWTDALASLKAGRPVKSDARRKMEESLSLSPEEVRQSDDDMLRIAGRRPIVFRGRQVVMTEDMLLVGAEAARKGKERLALLFTRPESVAEVPPTAPARSAPAAAKSGLGQAEGRRLAALVNEAFSDPSAPSAESRRECWALLEGANLSQTDFEETRRAFEDGTAGYLRSYYEDALASLKSRQAVKSAHRQELERLLRFPRERVSKDEADMARIAARQPVSLGSEPFVVTQEYLQMLIAKTAEASKRIELLFTRPAVLEARGKTGRALRAADERRLLSLVSQTVQAESPPAEGTRREFWALLDGAGLSPEQERLMLRSYEVGAVGVQRVYFVDALASLRSGKPVKSALRQELEDFCAYPPERVSQNDDDMQRIATRTPLNMGSQSVVLTEEVLLSSISLADEAMGRLRLLFTRP